MKTYAGIGARNAVTPQSQPIPDSNQEKNNAGGYSFVVDDWARLERFLILGSEKGTYYVNERELTVQNADCVKRCIATDGQRTAEIIRDISVSGRAPKNDPALLALAMVASLGDDGARLLAFRYLSAVARTGTHLLHFISFVEQFRGWGRGLRTAVAKWFNEKSPKDLAYQITKYPSRDKWSMRDVLRLAHVKPVDDNAARLFKYAVGKGGLWVDETPLDEYMSGVDIVAHSTDAKTVASVVRGCRLPREVIPTELLKSPEVWEALLEDMPMTAMIRNLATMTRVGVIAPLSDGARKVIDQLSDTERLRKSRVHPIAILSALLTYKSGKGVRGTNTWTPVPTVIEALDAAFYESFGNVQPSGARMLLGLDVSGSMAGTQVAGIPGMSAIMAESAMALITARVEPNYHILAFDTNVQDVSIGPRMRLDDVVSAVSRLVNGGTDCAAPLTWARETKTPVDIFAIYTDSETWAGHSHPSQSLNAYRNAMGIPAKMVVVAMCANRSTIGDSRDAGILDVVGFDTIAPSLIADFSRLHTG
jgi:60 kDa SS-A/Ro ribonucleoprotein